MAKSRVYFENLDALRFIAFFMVFITHGISPIFHILFGESGIKILLMGLGAQGVSIFFVLSGFLITYLILKEIEINGKLNIFSFYSRRFLRIWPLFFLVMIHGFWFYPFLHRLFGNEIIVCSNPIYNFLFLNNFDALALTINQSSCFEPHITTSWSVAIEEQFYLVWPILFLVIRPKNYIWIFISVFMVSLAFRIYNYNNSWLLYFHTLGASGDLAIGGFFAYMSLNSKKWLAFFANLSNSSRLIFYISAILIFILRNHIFVYEYGLVVKRGILTIIYVLVIMDQNFNKNTFLKLNKFKTISFWGTYTYGLYFFHRIAILYVRNVMDKIGIDYQNSLQGSIMVAFIAFLLSFLLSYLSFHYFESYFLRLKNRYAYITR